MEWDLLPYLQQYVHSSHGLSTWLDGWTAYKIQRYTNTFRMVIWAFCLFYFQFFVCLFVHFDISTFFRYSKHEKKNILEKSLFNYNLWSSFRRLILIRKFACYFRQFGNSFLRIGVSLFYSHLLLFCIVFIWNLVKGAFLRKIEEWKSFEFGFIFFLLSSACISFRCSHFQIMVILLSHECRIGSNGFKW